MKVTKIFVLIVAIAMVFTACAPAATEVPAPTDMPAPTEAPAATMAPAATEVPAATDVPMEQVELRFSYYADGTEADVMQPIIDKFMAENPDISVVLDVVPYQTIDEQLPIQVETGEGPD